MSDLGEPFIISLTGDGRDGGKLNITLLRWRISHHSSRIKCNNKNKEITKCRVSTLPGSTAPLPAVRTLLANDDLLMRRASALIEIDVRMVL